LFYEKQEKYDQAEKFYVESLEKSKKIRGEDHPDTLCIMNGLAGSS
jgi:hypothetical protein